MTTIQLGIRTPQGPYAGTSPGNAELRVAAEIVPASTVSSLGQKGDAPTAVAYRIEFTSADSSTRTVTDPSAVWTVAATLSTVGSRSKVYLARPSTVPTAPP